MKNQQMFAEAMDSERHNGISDLRADVQLKCARPTPGQQRHCKLARVVLVSNYWLKHNDSKYIVILA